MRADRYVDVLIHRRKSLDGQLISEEVDLIICADSEPARATSDIRRYDAASDGRDARRAQDHIPKIVVGKPIIRTAESEPFVIEGDRLVEEVESHAVGPVVLPLFCIEVVIGA